MIVVDASAAIELILGTNVGDRVAARIASQAESLHAPYLLDLEVAQVLRRHEAFGTISSSDGEQALVALVDLGVARYSHDVLLPRIWQLRHNLTAYDACYVALAETLAAPLLTCDARLARTPGHTAVVELV